MRGIEYPPYGYGDVGLDEVWGEIGEFLTMRDAMDLGLGTLSGGAGVLLSAAVMPRIPKVKENAKVMVGVTTALGIIGGFLLSKLHRGTGIGFAAGTGGFGLASLIGDLVGIDVNLKPRLLPPPAGWGRNLFSPGVAGQTPALKQTVVERERLFGNALVEKVRAPGLSNAVVERERLFGQANNDSEWDDDEVGPGAYLTM